MSHETQPTVTCNCNTGNNLTLPPTVTDGLEGSHLKKVNMVLLEYARDTALLQSRAYDAVLKALSSSDE